MFFKEGDVILVYLPLNLPLIYSYIVPPTLILAKGDIVLVPLRNRQVYGIVFKETTEISFTREKLKPVISKSSYFQPLKEEMLKFLELFAKYNMVNFGSVLKMVINIAGIDFTSLYEVISINNDKISQLKLTKARQQLLSVIENEGKIEKKDLLHKANVGKAVLDKLILDDFLNVENFAVVSDFQKNITYRNDLLSEQQKEVVATIKNCFSSNSYVAALLEGLPGSGKTEVYFDILNSYIKLGKQVLILLPEIGLSTQIVDRFKLRFGVDPYVWHSDITKKNKQDAYLAASNGNLKVVIGARSALFLPFNNLGLIIVDEEHDSSYKQEDNVIYNARDMAVLRAKIYDAHILLCSATPSLESINNVNKSKYGYAKLQGRYNKMDMPNFQIIDMKKEKLKYGCSISDTLINKIHQTLEKKEQVLLFINRRGYASCFFCKSCNEKATCKNCSTSLVEHRSRGKLVCHFCGYNIKIHNTCNHCHEKDQMISIGVGIEKVYEEVKVIFPDKRIISISSDTITSHKKAREIVESINRQEYDILIGTQIISKGYNFPFLTLVGIIDADFTYDLDLKSNEKAWQILYQVAGRSGRDKLKGEVILQTYNPNNKILQHLVRGNYADFVKEEFSLRAQLNFPPFGKLAAIIISCKNQQQLDSFANELYLNIPKEKDYDILGPVNAPIYFLRSKYRKRFLIKTSMDKNIQKILHQWLLNLHIPSYIKLQIDIDPISFY